MKKVLTVLVVFGVGIALGRLFDGPPPRAEAGNGGAEKCAAKNGDVNADGGVDLSDALTILGNLFLGNPPELVPQCAPPAAPSGLPDTGQKKCYDASGAALRQRHLPGPGRLLRDGLPLGRPFRRQRRWHRDGHLHGAHVAEGHGGHKR